MFRFETSMEFSLDIAKNGKNYILFENYKFREGYVVKSGDITWRCLGKTCNATLKTDETKKRIISANTKHSGAHPVTMRSLSSPARSSPSTVRAAVTASTGSPASLPSTPTTPPTRTFGPEPDSIACSTPAETTSAMLQEENMTLRSENARLKEEVRVILDHSIESDSRLIQYTTEIFTAGLPSQTPIETNLSVDAATNFNQLGSTTTTAEIVASVLSSETNTEMPEVFLLGYGAYGSQS